MLRGESGAAMALAMKTLVAYGEAFGAERLVSGSVLAETRFKRGFPIVEYNAADLYSAIGYGDWVEVDGETGEIRVERISDRP